MIEVIAGDGFMVTISDEVFRVSHQAFKPLKVIEKRIRWRCSSSGTSGLSEAEKK